MDKTFRSSFCLRTQTEEPEVGDRTNGSHRRSRRGSTYPWDRPREGVGSETGGSRHRNRDSRPGGDKGRGSGPRRRTPSWRRGGYPGGPSGGRRGTRTRWINICPGRGLTIKSEDGRRPPPSKPFLLVPRPGSRQWVPTLPCVSGGRATRGEGQGSRVGMGSRVLGPSPTTSLRGDLVSTRTSRSRRDGEDGGPHGSGLLREGMSHPGQPSPDSLGHDTPDGLVEGKPDEGRRPPGEGPYDDHGFRVPEHLYDVW